MNVRLFSKYATLIETPHYALRLDLCGFVSHEALSIVDVENGQPDTAKVKRHPYN